MLFTATLYLLEEPVINKNKREGILMFFNEREREEQLVFI